MFIENSVIMEAAEINGVDKWDIHNALDAIMAAKNGMVWLANSYESHIESDKNIAYAIAWDILDKEEEGEF